MSIATEISRLQTAKADIKTAIEAKGVTVPSSAKLDTYDDYIAAIQTGVGDHLHTIQNVTEEGVTTEQEVMVQRASTYTTVPTNAFKNNTVLLSIMLPPGVTTINGSAFYGCSNLNTVFPLKDVTSIKNYAFQNTGNLKISIYVPNLTYIEAGAFSGSGIIGIENLGSITTLYSETFKNCTNLNYAILPNTITDIKSQSFYNCTKLKNVNIPTSCTAIRSSSFWKVPAPMDINCPNLTLLETTAFVTSGVAKITDLGSITQIYSQTFKDCTSLVSATLPSTLTTISSQAFYNCNKLTTCNIPTSVTSFGDSAFCKVPAPMVINCPNLTTLTQTAFSDSGVTTITDLGSITTVGGYAFKNCYSLQTAVLPSTVTEIKTQAFYNCTGMTTLTCNATTPPTLGGSALDRCNSLAHIYVPSASVSAYQSASGWSSKASIISAIS